MEDNTIIDLYFKRSERAIAESRNKYGSYCSVIANNILHSDQDTEECVNDTWFKAWNVIPPQKPPKLSAFLGKLTRNLAIDRYRRSFSLKRGGGEVALCLEELAECVGKDEGIIDSIAVKEVLDKFLENSTPKARELFILRYWYMYSVEEAAKKCGMNKGTAKMSLYRSRETLREMLEEAGIDI